MAVNVTLSPLPILQFFDNTGKPAVGGTLLTQVGGVNYPTYSDAGGTTALPNPIPLNSRGEVSTAAGASSELFLEDNVSYTFTLKDADGNQLWSIGNIVAPSPKVESVATIAALKTLTGVGISNYQSTIVDGYYAAGDGGGGIFWWNAASTTADNGGTIIAPTGVATGRWYRIYSGAVHGEWFGMSPAIADNGPPFLNAIHFIMGTQGSITASGGTLELGTPGTYTFTTNPGILPYDGSTTAPRQASLIISGTAAGAQSYQPSIGVNPGVTLDLAYTIPGTQNAKIDTRGSGVLTLRNINITDSSGSADPFLMTTNTIIRREGTVAFLGTKTGTACDQDAIILGGTSQVIGDGQQGMFQGYGTIIDGFHFNGIRRCITLQSQANGVPIRNNTIWANCGSSEVNGAPILINGDPAGTGFNLSGVLCDGNTIEAEHYVYAIRCNGVLSSFFQNGVYDAGTSYVAAYRFESNCSGNTVMSLFRPSGTTLISDAATDASKQTVFDTSNEGTTSQYTQRIQFNEFVTINNGNAWGATILNMVNANSVVLGCQSARAGFTFNTTPAGGSFEQLAQLADYTGNTYVFELGGTTSLYRGTGDTTLEAEGAHFVNLKANGTTVFSSNGTVPAITGALSAVTDANAKAVLTSIISALTFVGLATNGTT